MSSLSAVNWQDEQGINDFLCNYLCLGEYTLKKAPCKSEAYPVTASASVQIVPCKNYIYDFPNGIVKIVGRLAERHLGPFSRESYALWTYTPGPVEQEGMGTMVKGSYLKPVRLSKIKSEGITLKLNKPIELMPVFINEEVIFEIPDLNIVSSGVSSEDAISELQSDIIWLWKEYVEDNDEVLSEDAVKLKNRLIDMVAEVTHD